MEWNHLTLAASVTARGGAGFIDVWLDSRADDRRWGKHHPPGE